MNSPRNVLPYLGFHRLIFHHLQRFRYFSFALAAALLLWNLNYAPVWNPDEGRYVSASLEMLSPFDGSTPDWIVPHLNTLPRLNKPPLVYWCAATLFEFFGPSVAVARLVSAFAAIGVLLVLWRLGSAAFGEKTGILAALIWVSSALPFTLARMLSTDMLLAFSMALALLGIYKIIAPPANRRASKAEIAGNAAIAGIGLGLALLAKGPVGVALPLAVLAAWLLLIRFRKPSFQNSQFRNSPARVLAPIICALLFAGVLAAPWYLAIDRSHPGFIQKFVFGENLARLTGATAYHDPKPLWFYAPVVIVGLLPWTLFLWPAFQNLRASFSARAKTNRSTPGASDAQLADSQNRARWFLWLWAAAVIALFSFSSTKLVTYILPALPPFVLLIADGFITKTNEKSLRHAVSLTTFLLSFLAVLLPVLFFSPQLLADKIVPQSVAWPFIILMSAILWCGVFALWRTLNNPTFRIGAVNTLVTTGAVLFMALTGFMSRVAPYEDASPMLIALRPFLQPGDRIVQFKTFQPSAIFYTGAPSMIVDFVNTSGLEEDRFAASPLFPKDQKAVQNLFQSPHRIYVLVRWKHAHWPTLPTHFVVAANNDYRLLSNRPTPTGFSYDFVAPEKRNRPLSPACQNFSPDC